MRKSGKFLLLTTAALHSAAVFACTSWVIHPSVSKSHRMLLQKSRDSKFTVLNASIRTEANGIRWMQIGSDGGAMFGLNSYGVAMTSNTGDKLSVTPKRPPKHRHGTISAVVSSCTSAAEGIPYVEALDRNPAGIFLIADPRHAYLVESGLNYGEHTEITGGICVVANKMHLPGEEYRSNSPAKSIMFQRAREANTRAALKKAARKSGGYTPTDTFQVSRIITGNDAARQYAFRKNSISGVCFELDAEFPAELSTAYIALGPQRHTPYIPFPMALEQFPEKIRSGEWAETARRLRARDGDANPHLARIVELEREFMAEYDRTREEAHRLLRAGKRDEAVKLLNDCCRRQFARADNLMTDLLKKSPEP